MSTHARLTAWRDKQELLHLRTLFFPEETAPTSPTLTNRASIERAIALTRLYTTRTRIPHVVQSTAYLFSILLDTSSSLQPDLRRLSASMALIRFVNGLLDPGQQSQYAIPLQVLARKIGLPREFVEFRHGATHESLPSLEMCERVVLRALQWLFEGYWADVLKSEDEELEVDDDAKKRLEDEIVAYWKAYRRVRRRDLSRVVKWGDTSEVGREYWGCVRKLKTTLSKDQDDWRLGYEVMVGRLCSGKLGFEQSKLLYGPLLDHLASHDDQFLETLLDVMSQTCYEYAKLKGLDGRLVLNTDSEWKICKKWMEHLIQSGGLQNWNGVIECLGKRPDEFHLSLLKQIPQTPETKVKVQAKIQFITNVLSETQTKRFNDTDDILADLESLKKRKLVAKRTVVKLFEPHPQWEPKPFGVL